MANVNINFNADSAKIESAIKNIDKEIQKVIAGSTSLEQSFNSALGKTSTNFAELTQKVSSLGTAFEKMRGSTQLANLAQASTVAGGAINTLIMELQGLNGASEENTQKISQMIMSLQLNENSLNQVTQVYQKYISSLAVGSQAHTEAIQQLNLFKNAQMQVGATAPTVAGGMGSMNNAIGQLGYAIGDANMFLVNFRMGMMSIGNNIPIIVQGFMQAKAAAAATGQTFTQTLAGSIMGTGGILIAINALMFALQAMPGILEKINNASATTASGFSRLTKSTREKIIADDDDIKNMLRQKIQLEAVDLAMKSGNLTKIQKKQIINELNTNYKDYLSSLKINKVDENNLEVALRGVNVQLAAKLDNMLKHKLFDKISDKIVDTAMVNIFTLQTNIDAANAKRTALESDIMKKYTPDQIRKFQEAYKNPEYVDNPRLGRAELRNPVPKDVLEYFDQAVIVASNMEKLKKETDKKDKMLANLSTFAKNNNLNIFDANVPALSGLSGKLDSADERDKKISETYLDPKLITLEQNKEKAERVLSEQLANNLISQENYDLEKKRLDKKFIDEQKKVYDEFIEKHGKKITEKFRDSITLRSEQLGTDSNLAQAAINAEQAKFNKALVEKVTDAGKNVDLTGIEDGSFTENLLTKMAESKAVSEQFNKTFPEYKDFSAMDWTTIGKTESELQNFPAYIAWKFKTALEKSVKDEQAKLQLKMIDDTNATSKKLNEYKVYDDPYKLKMLQLQQNKDSDIMKLAQNTNQQVEFYKAVGADESFIDNIKLQFLQDSLEITKYYAKLEDDAKEENAQKDRDRMKETLEFAKGAFREHTIAYKAMAVAQATIDMWSAWQRALLLPPIWKEIEQALILASGMANIARISGIQGFAKGGIVNQPTIGMIGEAGPEIIAPVSDYAKGQAALIQAVKQDMIINSVSNNNLRLKIKGSDLLIVSDKANTKQNGRKLGGLNYA